MMTTLQMRPCILVGMFWLFPICTSKTVTSSADDECDAVKDKELLQSSGKSKVEMVESGEAGAGWDISSAVSDGICLDIPGGHAHKTAPVSTWTCNNLAPQSFYFYPDNTLHYAANENLCVDIAAEQCADGPNKGQWVCFKKGAKVQLYDCHSGLNQQFVFKDVEKGLAAGIQAYTTDLCIADATGKYGKSATLTMEDCSSEGAKFKIPALFGSQLRPVSFIGTGKKSCMDAQNNQVKNGVPMLIWDCLKQQGALLQSNQNFKYNKDDSSIRFVRFPKMCLDTPPSLAEGNIVQVWECWGGANQQWTLEDNQIKLKSKPTLCIGDKATTYKNNAAMTLTKCSTLHSFAMRGIDSMNCPWKRGTVSEGFPACGDNSRKSGWHCVLHDKGQRRQCPAQNADMCAEETCGGDDNGEKRDFCCMPTGRCLTGLREC